MARQLPQRVSRDEAQDLLDQAQELPSLMCFHNKPCVFNIYDLDDASQCEITSWWFAFQISSVAYRKAVVTQ